MVQNLGFEVQGSEFMVYQLSLGLRVSGLRFGI
jgi:hypothetical protein